MESKRLTSKFFLPPQTSGFTLIELLVVMMTMALLFGLGYANYRDYQRRQVLEGAVRMIKGDLRYAQEMALLSKKPDTTPDNDCETSTLQGYRFRRNNQSTYSIEARCSGGNYTEKGPVSLPSGVRMPGISGGNSILFYVLSGGIDRSSDVTITLRFQSGGMDLADPQTITITPGGEIK